MLCDHLRPLDEALRAAGIRETCRGQVWSDGCREWVYYDCYLDRQQIRRRYALAPCVADHEHFGTHDGQEEGLLCTEHRDGVMGLHRRSPSIGRVPTFPPAL